MDLRPVSVSAARGRPRTEEAQRRLVARRAANRERRTGTKARCGAITTGRHFNWSRAVLVLIDAVTINACIAVALWLRFEGNIPHEYWRLYLDTTVWITPLLLAVGVGGGLYNRIWEYASADAALVVVWTATLTVGLGGLITFLTMTDRYPHSVLALTWCLLILTMGGARFGWRYLRERIYHLSRVPGAERTRVLVYGAGDAGVMLAKQMRDDRASRYEAVGFVDDNRRLKGMVAGGLRVLGTGEDLPALVRRHTVEEVVAALPTAAGSKLKGLRDFGASHGIRVRTIPRLLEMVDRGSPLSLVRPIDVADILGRASGLLTLDTRAEYLADATVLVTGAGGSIGSEICRQLCRYGPRRVVLLGRGENRIHKIYHELTDKHLSTEFVPVICNLTSREALASVLAQYQPQTVLHAGAHKHVYLMEVNAVEAARNNVLGTAALADVAEECGVDRLIFISTDKAVGPTSVMGATKCLCERLLLCRNGLTRTRFMAVRFGNVVGSAGSVLPIFQDHAVSGRPVPVTDPEVDRFFMTIEEAAFLVLQAGSLGEGGDLFVLDMGEPVRIVDVARTVLQLSGRDPAAPDAIEYIGLRQGEKLHESLTNPWEELEPTACALVRKVRRVGAGPDCLALSEALARLRKAVAECDEEAVRSVLSAATNAPALLASPRGAADSGDRQQAPL